MTTESFYDDLAAYYHHIFPNWEASMDRQGRFLAEALRSEFSDREVRSIRVLDVAAGIGTQALPLATRGFSVVARDLSRAAVARLDREARQRGLSIDCGVSDMRRVHETVTGRFDSVMALDNAVPHLQDDGAIIAAFDSMGRTLRPTGIALISVRDYDQANRSPTSTHPYEVRQIAGRTLRFRQEWRWIGPSHYDTTMIGEEEIDGIRKEFLRTTSRYYAISLQHLEELLLDSGWVAKRIQGFYQPLLLARRIR